MCKIKLYPNNIPELIKELRQHTVQSHRLLWRETFASSTLSEPTAVLTTSITEAVANLIVRHAFAILVHTRQ